jgi:hypothetical protein
MNKYHELNMYSVKEYTELIRTVIIGDYCTPEKLISNFYSILKTNVEKFVSPKVLGKTELESHINAYSSNLVDVILRNITDENISIMLSNEFKDKCSTGVVMANEREYLEEVASKFVKGIIAKVLTADLQAKTKALKRKK